MKTIINYLLLLLISFFPISTNAQWTSDTDINTLVTSSERWGHESLRNCRQEKHTLYTGKLYAAPINYELRLQILDVEGFQLARGRGDAGE